MAMCMGVSGPARTGAGLRGQGAGGQGRGPHPHPPLRLFAAGPEGLWGPSPLQGPVRLNLGCGRDVRDGRAGWVNVDIAPLKGVDVVCDLAEPPYPFAAAAADHVLMSHVLEHLEDTVTVLEEVHRILRPGGTAEVVVPHFRHRNAFTDPTHRRFFTEESMDYFTDEGHGPRRLNYYSPARFRIVEREVRRERTRPDWWRYRLLERLLHVDLVEEPAEIRWVLEAVKA